MNSSNSRSFSIQNFCLAYGDIENVMEERFSAREHNAFRLLVNLYDYSI